VKIEGDPLNTQHAQELSLSIYSYILHSTLCSQDCFAGLCVFRARATMGVRMSSVRIRSAPRPVSVLTHVARHARA